VSSAVEVFSPGPLPVIKAVCVECGLIETVNEQVDWDEQQCRLSPGHRVMSLVMNFLTEGQPMSAVRILRKTDTTGSCLTQ
jgi:hypothetical protein